VSESAEQKKTRRGLTLVTTIGYVIDCNYRMSSWDRHANRSSAETRLSSLEQANQQQRPHLPTSRLGSVGRRMEKDSY